MAIIFNPSGGDANNNTGAVAGGETSSTIIEAIKVGNGDVTGGNSVVVSETVNTIDQTAVANVTSVSDTSGYLTFVLVNPGVDVNDVFQVDGPFTGSYRVGYRSGTTHVTTSPWYSCYSGIAGPYGQYSVSDGDIDSNDTTVFAPQLGVLCGPGLDDTGPSRFQGYRSHVYTDCWECFSGSIDPCDVTSTEVTLWEDKGDDHKVAYNNGGCVKTEDGVPGLNNPSGENDLEVED